MLKKLFFTLFLILPLTSDLWAQDLSRRTRRVRVQKKAKTQEKSSLPISLNLGNHTEFVGFVQKSKKEKEKLFEFRPTIGIGTEITLSNGFSFLPEINWVLPIKGPKKLIKNLFMLRGDISYDLAYL